jgi:hypothetical protein
MRALLGYYEDVGREAPKVEEVTISTLQTMRYLLSADHDKALLRGMVSYKVTTLNRDLQPLLDKTQQLLDDERLGPGGRARGPGADSGAGGYIPAFLAGGAGQEGMASTTTAAPRPPP